MNCVGDGGLAGRFGIPCKPQDSGIAYAGFQIAVTDDAPLSIDPLPTDFPVTVKSSLAFSGCHDFGGVMITGRTGALEDGVTGGRKAFCFASPDKAT